ncbi:MAG: ROK family transcriptional regulator [Deltaproteobacteria bacterium]|nr:ROK family transcriptional regulator [Deltaproteobacteria bacterium]
MGGVLQLLWQERQISRAEIARRSGLSRSTVSEIVGDLLKTRLVAEVGDGPSQGGRRPIVLQFQDDAYAVLGIDMGAGHISVALANLRGQLIAWEHRSHPVRTDPEGTVSCMKELSEACLRQWKGGTERLVGIGIAVPSPVDPRNPDRVSDVVMPAWQGHNVGESLRKRFRLPVFVDNDANLAALAEHWWGAGRGIDDFTYVKVATGVGAGHMIRGQIYRGAHGIAGEIGHLAIDPQGELCMCGLRGCLATRVGSRALVARASALLLENPGSALAGREVTIGSIEDAALGGDRLALQVVGEAADYLGIAVAGMLNLMNPARVIIGGGLARLGELLLAPMRRSISSRTLVNSIDSTEIVTGELGGRAVALGAATLVLQNALADLRHFRNAAAGS